MKTELPKATDCYWKIVDVIRSCVTKEHLSGAWNMIANFEKMFPEDIARHLCLSRILTTQTKTNADFQTCRKNKR